MQLDFKSGFTKKTIASPQLIAATGLFWQKIYKIIFFIFLTAMIVLGGYIWNRSLSGGAWSEEKKQEYLNSQNTGVVFNQKNFEKALADIELRKNGSAKNTETMKDIFKDY